MFDVILLNGLPLRDSYDMLAQLEDAVGTATFSFREAYCEEQSFDVLEGTVSTCFDDLVVQALDLLRLEQSWVHAYQHDTTCGIRVKVRRSLLMGIGGQAAPASFYWGGLA